jgi:hypothetical protein
VRLPESSAGFTSNAGRPALAGTPGDANTPRVTINICGPILDKNSQTTVAGIPIPAQSSDGIAIEFVNEANQAATLVNFNVNPAGQQFVIRDVGKFAPGVSIKRQYRNGAGQAFVLPNLPLDLAPPISWMKFGNSIAVAITVR